LADQELLSVSNLVCLGDSVMAGVHNSSGNDPCTLAAAALGLTPVNLAVSGADSLHVLDYQLPVALQYSSQAILVMVGMNDNLGTGAVPPGTFFNRLAGIVTRSQNAGKRIVLMTPNLAASSSYIDLFPPYLAAMDYVAKHMGVPLVDNYMAFSKAYWSGQYSTMWANAVHPSDAGAQLIADNAVAHPEYFGL
jgi:lysophospholipase L1-like esterase